MASETDSKQSTDGNQRTHTPKTSHFSDFISSGWREREEQMPERLAVSKYAGQRRKVLSERFPEQLIVIPAGAVKVRSNDTDFRFRPHTIFTYLTGWGADAVPDSVLVLYPAAAQRGPVLFFREPAGRDTDEFYANPAIGEFWNGPRPGLAHVAAQLGVETRNLAELEAHLAQYDADIITVPGADAALDRLVARIRPEQKNLSQNTALDAEMQVFSSEQRLVKDDYEVSQMRAAIAATRKGFDDVLSHFDAVVASERGERVVEGRFWSAAREHGNDVGYDTIAAAGDHACYLHWTRNDGAVKDGDLLLLDAGVELDSLYTADVTRTLPVNGKFTPRQREVYEAVLEAADAAFAVAKPGVRFRDVHNAALAVIARRVSEWGLLPVSLEQTIDPEWQLHRRFMVHGTSHHLGIDVHDCAQARKEMYVDGILRPGMVFTIEPGLYFQADDDLIPADFRGIGVRVEDDVLVTETGVESLTGGFPRTADEVEQWVCSLRFGGRG